MKNLQEMDYKEFYKRIGAQQGWDFSSIKCSKFETQSFDYYKILSQEILPNHVVLDIGCGDSKKVIRYVNAKKIVGIDAIPEMIEKSLVNLKTSNSQTNHSFILADAFGKYDFDDNSFNAIINRHCGCNEAEMFRVLKKGGKYFQEDIDETDCLELKVLFGRGQGYPITSRLCDTVWQRYIDLGFAKIEYFPIRQVEFYETEQDLWNMLCSTPIIPNFGVAKKDKLLFEKYCNSHKTNQGIRLDRELFGFILTK